MRPTLSAVPSALLAAFVTAIAPSSASAMTTEPNGLVVPRDPSDPTASDYDRRYTEISLRRFFATAGESIDWRTDAVTMPAVFSPLCSFSATFVFNQAGSHYGLAWYNAPPDRTVAPTGAELHTIVPANTAVGTVVASADIRSSAAYTGGLVGFALLGGQTHYSEAQWDVACTSCSPAAPWVTALVYRSALHPDGYYLAFEDGNVSSSAFGNDGDFNDDVFLVTGVQCAGEGVPCNTQMQGACANGVAACDARGVLGCTAVNQPHTETCDGADNDCNGTVDDGDNLCGTGAVCDGGRCVPRCLEGGCYEGQTCTSRGTCVESVCEHVVCASGLRCIGGMCVAPCDGVTCPAGQLCRDGRCSDPCAGVTCGAQHVCSQGVCVAACMCRGCDTGLVCATDGRCVTTACNGVVCPAGTVCGDGRCIDVCDGVHCPAGQSCTAGQCVNDAPPDASVPMDASASGRDSGAGASDGAAVMRDASGTVHDAAIAVVDGARTSRGGGDASCGCRTAGHAGGERAGAWCAFACAIAAVAARTPKSRRVRA